MSLSPHSMKIKGKSFPCSLPRVGPGADPSVLAVIHPAIGCHFFLPGLQSPSQPWASCSHLCASVTKQYNLVPAKGLWCSAAGKITAGLVQSNGSLPPCGWLIVTCGLTACTPGSAPSPTLGNEYGKPLPFMGYYYVQFEITTIVSMYCQSKEASILWSHHEETRDKEIMEGTVPVARRQGWPCTSWMENINTWTRPRGRVNHNDRGQR